jgi:hypothetical protein
MAIIGVVSIDECFGGPVESCFCAVLQTRSGLDSGMLRRRSLGYVRIEQEKEEKEDG